MSKEDDNNQQNIIHNLIKNADITPIKNIAHRLSDNRLESFQRELNTGEEYLDTNINLDSITRSDFNLLEIKKELTDIKHKDILSQYVKPFDNIEEDISEEKKQKNVEKTIKQWLSLQKTIKEEITLEDVIIHQQNSDTEKLKNYFISYYDIKLKKRKNFEDINELNMGNEDYLNTPSFYIQEEVEKNLKDACEPIKNLLFTFRNNYDYLLRLLSLIKPSDFSENRKKIYSIVELFNNQFYENILLPNPEQQELLILIYKLFEEETMSMCAAAPEEFLNNDSFLGIFLSSYSKRQEIMGYISTILNPIILYIDNQERECIDLSITSLKRYLDKQEKDKKAKKRNSIKDKIDFTKGQKALNDYLFGRIPKTKLKFKKNFELEAEKEKEDDIKTYTPLSKDDNEIFDSERNNIYIRRVRRTVTQKSSIEFYKEVEYNNDYLTDINREKLLKKLKNINDCDLKDFYIKQIELLSHDSKIFSHEGILKILNKEKNSALVENYRHNFIFTRIIIEVLLQTIIDKIITLPYPLRCICKIIYLLISKKFPFLSTYSINSFIGKFILNKCIFPVLKLESKNIKDSRIFSSKTKNCLELITEVLSKANSGELYDTYSDPEKTIFNNYLLEIIPILNKFYEKLIDVQLPKVLEDLINETSEKMEENNYRKIFNFRHKKKGQLQPINETPKIPENKEMPPPLYNYFVENSDEILHLQSICFSAEDILFLTELIGRDLQKFSDLPKFKFFTKTYQRIINENEKLRKLVTEPQTNSERSKKKPFFVIFKEDKHEQLQKLLKQKKKDRSTFESSEQDSDLINKRIKFCIKRILKGLNLLNNKDFAYLNFADTTDKFFSTLKYTLNELGEYSELSNDIPLKWYAQYISNYKKDLPNNLQENDYSKLYEDIYTEETNILNELKSLSNIVITRDGMNLRCAEKILEKAQYELKIIEEAKKFIQIEKFIDSQRIEVCLTYNEEFTNIKQILNSNSNTNSNINTNISINTDESSSLLPLPVIISDIKSCIHSGNANEKNPNHNPNHIFYIRDFISIFSNKIYSIKDKKNKIRLSKLLKEDIINGDRKYQIDKIIEKYMDYIKKQVKDPSNKKLFGELKEDEITEIIEKIQNHILRYLYKNIYPSAQTEKDIKFYENIRKLEWIKPEHLEIKKLYVNQLKFAEKYIKRMDKAFTAYDKLDCINNAYVTMNNTVKFISGKNEDAGQDELTPLFQYILIKAQPKYFFTNLNYIKCLLSENELMGPRGFYVSQMESASSFIMNLNHTHLNMNEEEFNSKSKIALDKYNKENIANKNKNNEGNKKT
jgi:hypothetical protein